MKFMFIYRGGDVPPEKTQENVEHLWKWIGDLKSQGYETQGFAGYGRHTVTSEGVTDNSGDVFGISIIEADSMEAALTLTKNWPELQYGGKIEVFESLSV
ncbi:YciI family protein [Paenibacillus lemnae]|uniref:YCII-related domain-containing protein n=1 Tax=Paenibacillus lemnae TaxID=1330551 RepID=A0A848MBL3_PAELE|nr:YciI family protein [Paenibacillus lemnae]NMO97629.1 hypothetical protein [Paenibacillus lemnae]